MTNEEMLMQILEGQNKINKRLDNIEERLEEIKENGIITRSAANRNGEKLEELVSILNETNVVSIKY